jgi:hypothetical protein
MWEKAFRRYRFTTLMDTKLVANKHSHCNETTTALQLVISSDLFTVHARTLCPRPTGHFSGISSWIPASLAVWFDQEDVAQFISFKHFLISLTYSMAASNFMRVLYNISLLTES